MELFQDSGDRTNDILKALGDLSNLHFLIQDIKTEIDQIQKALERPKSEEDEKKEQDDPLEDDPIDEEVMKFLEDLTEKTFKIDNLPPLLPNGKRLELPGPGGSNRDPWVGPMLKGLFWLFRKLSKLETEIKNRVIDRLTANQVDSLIHNVQYMRTEMDLYNKLVSDRLEELTNDLTECCRTLEEAVEQCCSSTSDKLDDISDKLKDLNPKTDADKSLAIQNASRAILAEVQSIRGLL
jgi:Mg2+ and Co2+ transporter CorA